MPAQTLTRTHTHDQCRANTRAHTAGACWAIRLRARPLQPQAISRACAISAMAATAHTARVRFNATEREREKERDRERQRETDRDRDRDRDSDRDRERQTGRAAPQNRNSLATPPSRFAPPASLTQLPSLFLHACLHPQPKTAVQRSPISLTRRRQLGQMQ